MAMRFGCCCGGVDPCSVCDFDAHICCLKITRVSGAITFVKPWYMQSSVDCPTSPWTNMCGQGVLSKNQCGLPTVGIQWRPVEGDCDNVIFHLNFEITPDTTDCNTSAILEANLTFSAPKNWYTGVLSRTVGSEVITIEACTWGTHTDDVYTNTNTADEIILSYAWEEGADTRWITSKGKRLCGGKVCSSSAFGGFYWYYSLASDTITIFVSYANGAVVECVSLPYDNGNWVSNLGTLSFGQATGRMAVVATCASPPPPPSCDPYLCFPECLVKFCDPDVLPSALFLDVTSINGCCLNGSYEFTWNATESHYYSGKIGDFALASCGYVEIWYECSGATFQRRVKVTDVNGGVSETTQASPGACSGTPENFIDSFDVPSSFLTPLCFNLSPFYTDTVTFDVYTNN